MSNKTKEDYIQRTFSLCSKDFTNHIRVGCKRVSSASPMIMTTGIKRSLGAVGKSFCIGRFHQRVL